MKILETKNIVKGFYGNIAVNNVSISLEKGQITGLIGANGAGKTTLFNCISGYHHANSGLILYKGEAIQKHSAEKRCKKGIARTFQITKPFKHLSVIDNILVGGYNRAYCKKEAYDFAEESMDFVGLSDKRNNYAATLNTGEQRKLELARALATRPELLLLDEVMAGLTPTESKEMTELIRKINSQGMTVLMIEHIMPVVMKLSQTIYVLDRGELIAEGTPLEVSQNNRVIESYLGKK